MNARIIKAQANVAEAREALIDTARELQQRLAPRTLARDAWESAKVKGADLAEDAVDAVKSARSQPAGWLRRSRCSSLASRSSMGSAAWLTP